MNHFRRNPWIAAILNFCIPGLGYVYAGIKLEFSILLLCGIILYVFWIISLLDIQQILGNIWLNISFFLIMLGFGVDAFLEVKDLKK